MAFLVNLAGWSLAALAGVQAYFGLEDNDPHALYGAALILVVAIVTILLSGHIPHA